ncbi:MAG: hypothetical protein LBT64_02165, partial [Puniceicoccales bacterium]|nr:hypothetical protein [Puniceicoccales bacterium]
MRTNRKHHISGYSLKFARKIFGLCCLLFSLCAQPLAAATEEHTAALEIENTTKPLMFHNNPSGSNAIVGENLIVKNIKVEAAPTALAADGNKFKTWRSFAGETFNLYNSNLEYGTAGEKVPALVLVKNDNDGGSAAAINLSGASGESGTPFTVAPENGDFAVSAHAKAYAAAVGIPQVLTANPM